MGKQTLHINIPEPCHENWAEMTPTQCGAFCKACQKEVIDFTTKSEAEIVEILSTANGKVCGRIATDKLNRELTKYSPDPEWYSWKKWAIAAGVLLGINSVKGTGIENGSNPIVLANDTITRQTVDSVAMIMGGKMKISAYETETIDTIPNKHGDSIIISGKVTNESGEPLSMASVILKSTGIGALTDIEGNYQLSFPSGDYLYKTATVEVSYLGYESQERAVLLSEKNTLNVQLEERLNAHDLATVGGIMRITPAQRIKYFFLRIGRAFHKHKNE